MKNKLIKQTFEEQQGILNLIPIFVPRRFGDAGRRLRLHPDDYYALGTWPMYSKFFDYEGPLFHHLHLDFEAAKRVGRLGKPEAYYYPPQYNNYPGDFPHTYFGFDPDVTKEMVKERLINYE